MCHMDNIQQPDLYQNLNIIILYHMCDLNVHSDENNLIYSWREASIHHNIQYSNNFTFI